MMQLRICLVLVAIMHLWACSFKLVYPSERTALEKQMLGEYKPIDDEVVLYSVVRGDGESAANKPDKYELARLNQKFNEDEIDEFKDKSMIGETIDGFIALLPPGKGAADNANDLEKRIARILVAEENRDRGVIFEGVIAKNAELSASDLVSVRLNYAKTRRERAKDTHWLQDESGNWSIKSSLQVKESNRE